MNPTFTPPLTRRALSATRTGIPPGAGNATTTFDGPSSLPSVGILESPRPMRPLRAQPAPANPQRDSAESRRNASLNRLRAHRSLDPAELAEYDPLFQTYDGASAQPPADPDDHRPGGGHDFLTSLSQGPASFRNPFGQPHAASNTTFPVSIPNANLNPNLGTSSGNPYQQMYSLADPPSYHLYYPSMFDPYAMPLPVLQREYALLRREYENAVQKLNSNMNSIKTFWSPELKKERAMRKEESNRSATIHEQLKLATQEVQRQAQVIRQLQSELQCQYDLSRTIRDTEMQSVGREQYEAIKIEKDRFQKELALAKDSLRDIEIQMEAQRQMLAAKDDSVKKLVDMLQTKGSMTYTGAQDRLELEQCRARQIELENQCRRYEMALQQKDNDIRSLREECVSASDKLRSAQKQYGDHQIDQNPIFKGDFEIQAMRSLLDSKQARIAQLEHNANMYETEINRLRDMKNTQSYMHNPHNPYNSNPYPDNPQNPHNPSNYYNPNPANPYNPKSNTPNPYNPNSLNPYNPNPNPHNPYPNDKSTMEKENQELKSKMDKLELELSHKRNELQTNEMRLKSAEDQIDELRKRIDLTKDTANAKEQQIALLQADMKALRGKLETRNETIEQKTQHLQQAQLEKLRQQNEIADLNEQLKIKQSKITNLQRKLDSLEETIKERENQIDILKQRTNAPPSINQQHKIQDQLDEVNKERERLLKEIQEQRERLEIQRLEELETHRREVRDLRMAIETLQKDITDRQVLIESQQEKIADLNREMTSLRSDIQIQAARQGDGDFFINEFERLNRELTEARKETERLLTIVSALEKEKEELHSKTKIMEKQIEESQTCYSTTFEREIIPSSMLTDTNQFSKDDPAKLRQKEQRIEELEKALKENINMAAEREMIIAQQKQACIQMEIKLNQYKEQLVKIQHQYDELNCSFALLSEDKQDKDSLMRSLKYERKRHVGEMLQLKEEALLAAISEKDAHIALLETSQAKNPEELENLRRQKDKLIKKLKDENAQRTKVFSDINNPSAIASTRPSNVDMMVDGSSESPPNENKSSPVDQIVQSIRYVELQKKKLRVFIDQLVACILDIDPELLTGLPRTQQSSGVDIKLLKKFTHEQLLLELQQRDADCLQLQHYATQLMQRLALVQPKLVRRAVRLLDSFNGHPSTSEAFFYERLSRHYQKKVARTVTTFPRQTYRRKSEEQFSMTLR